MTFPRLQIDLTRTLFCLAIVALGTTPAQADPLARKQNDRTTQKVPIGQDEAPLGAPQASDKKFAEPEYWIGVNCEESTPAMRAQLNIDGGLTIADIAKNTPAQNAGLQIHDLILTIDGQPLRTVAELQHVVHASQGSALDIGILRGGKESSVTLQPERRPSCDELDPIILTIGPDEELDEKELEEFKKALESLPGASRRQILLFREGVVLKKVAHDDPSTRANRSKTPNTPNGAPPHLKVKDITEEAVLIERAEFQDGQLLSGCCMKLLKIIGEQIEMNSERLQELREERGTMQVGVQDENPSQEAKANEDPARLDRLILKLEVKLEMLQETQAMLNERIYERPKSNQAESEPGQSKRLEFRLRNWS